MSKRRNSKEVIDQINALITEADALKAKEELTPEESERLAEISTQLDGLTTEKEQAVAVEKVDEVKERMAQAARPAPRVAAQVRRDDTMNIGEMMRALLAADKYPETYSRARSLGIDLTANGLHIPVDYSALNFRKKKSKQRTIMSTGGSTSGAELIYQTYSQKITDALVYESPLLGFLGSETTGDGNKRTYFKLNNTSLMSAYNDNSGGTETVPTIPEVNMTTAQVVIAVKSINSGFQKITKEELRDSAIQLEARLVQNVGIMHARKMEYEIVQGSGDGDPGVQGLESVATPLDDVASWSDLSVKRLLTSIPYQYRANVLFLSNQDTKDAVEEVLIDDLGRSLFDRTIEDGIEFDTLHGKKWLVSRHVSADTVLCFAPEYYMLRMVSGMETQVFNERFWPNYAVSSLASFGGAWLGESSAIKSLALSGVSS